MKNKSLENNTEYCECCGTVEVQYDGDWCWSCSTSLDTWITRGKTSFNFEDDC